MDRSERTPILEPILLILKQRTGIATIASVLISFVMIYFGFDTQQILMIVSPIFVYVARQTVIDAGENGGNVVKEVVEVVEEVKDVLELIGIIEEEVLEDNNNESEVG